MRAAVGCLALAFVLVSDTAARAAELILNLDWLVFGRHIPYFVALEKGYYRDAGLDIKIVRGYGSADPINKIAAGQAAFGFGDAGSLILARSKGAQVKMVAMIYGKSPFVFFSLPEMKIAGPKDLEGKSIAAPTTDAPRTMFPVYAKLAGIDQTKVRWITIDGAQKDPMLLSKRTDLTTSFWVHLPTISRAAKAQGLTISMLKWADVGFELYSNGLLASDEMIKSEPQKVRSFVQATIKGHQTAFDRPDEAVDILLKHYPTLDRDVARAELDIIKEMTLSEDAKQHGIGWINEKTMQMTVDAVAAVFQIEKPVLSSTYSNDFLK
jgi:NitT/TauT family transport system substrate-binding protein